MKISIITVCYNDKDVIEKTILSVINQDYSNLEYIIVDGASSDGTLEIIKQYQKKYPIILISEKDDGIYDAMNKGSKVASGDYLNFMNAGDYFFSDNTISAVVPHLYSGEGMPPDVIREDMYIKLSELITLALEESIPQAVTTALKTGNAFLIDKLRDSLVDKYYEKLKEKKLI